MRAAAALHTTPGASEAPGKKCSACDPHCMTHGHCTGHHSVTTTECGPANRCPHQEGYHTCCWHTYQHTNQPTTQPTKQLHNQPTTMLRLTHYTAVTAATRLSVHARTQPTNYQRHANLLEHSYMHAAVVLVMPQYRSISVASTACPAVAGSCKFIHTVLSVHLLAIQQAALLLLLLPSRNTYVWLLYTAVLPPPSHWG